jgi:hypothetical protein
MAGDPSNSILTQAGKEQSFRRRVVELLGAVLRPKEVPLHLKCLVVVLLFLCLTASLVLTVFLLDTVLTIMKVRQVQPMFYAAVLGGHALAGVAVGFPLTIRMSTLEEAHLLEARLAKVQHIKRLKRARRTGASQAATDSPGE